MNSIIDNPRLSRLAERGLGRNEIWLIVVTKSTRLLPSTVSRVYDTLVATLAQNTNVTSCLSQHARNLSLSSVSRILVIIIFNIRYIQSRIFSKKKKINIPATLRSQHTLFNYPHPEFFPFRLNYSTTRFFAEQQLSPRIPTGA